MWFYNFILKNLAFIINMVNNFIKILIIKNNFDQKFEFH
jgi:hypothetical protein